MGSLAAPCCGKAIATNIASRLGRHGGPKHRAWPCGEYREPVRHRVGEQEAVCAPLKSLLRALEPTVRKLSESNNTLPADVRGTLAELERALRKAHDLVKSVQRAKFIRALYRALRWRAELAAVCLELQSRTYPDAGWPRIINRVLVKRSEHVGKRADALHRHRGLRRCGTQTRASAGTVWLREIAEFRGAYTESLLAGVSAGPGAQGQPRCGQLQKKHAQRETPV